MTFSGDTALPLPNSTETEGSGQNYFATQNNAANIALSFDGSPSLRPLKLGTDHVARTGTALFVCFTDNGAAYSLSVDGVEQKTTAAASSDPVCTATGAETILLATGLSQGAHSATLNVVASGTQEYQFYGGVVTGEVATNG